MESKLSASRSKRRRTVSWWELFTTVHTPFSYVVGCTVDLAQGHESKPREQRLQVLSDEVCAEVVQEDAREREPEVARAQAPPPRRPRRAEPAAVKLVRVEVEHGRASAGVDVVQGAADKTARQQAEVAAACDGEAEAADVPGGQRVLLDLPTVRRDGEGMAGSLRDAVAGVRQGEDARVVAKPQVGQNLEAPVPQVADRELWGAEPQHRLTREVLETGERALHVRPEGGRIGAEDQLVAVGVAPELVSSARDLAHELWVRLGDVAEHEERRPDPGLVQHVEQAVGRAYDGPRRPDLLPGEPPVEELVPVFQVDGQRVDRHRSLPTSTGDTRFCWTRRTVLLPLSSSSSIQTSSTRADSCTSATWEIMKIWPKARLRRSRARSTLLRREASRLPKTSSRMRKPKVPPPREAMILERATLAERLATSASPPEKRSMA